MKTITYTLQVLLVLFLAALYFFQNRLIYLPVRYSPHAEALFHSPVQRLEYKLGKFDQVAFYVPPLQNADTLPRHIWILFSGNAATALGYDAWLENLDNSPDGFLLIDYPGYGYNQGRPSPALVAQSADKAVAALADKFSTPLQDVLQRMGALGVSLGSAAALQFAVDHPQVRSLIMVAPFTSLRDMARSRYGFLYLLAHHVYNNEANLHILAERLPHPYAALFHGDADEVIPVTMARKLASENKDWLQYQEIKGATHGGVLYQAAPKIIAAMAHADEMP